MKKISIIGTGLSAIFSAIHLRKNTDLEINLFDKARGLGGRLATRRAEDGKFDHGAQYFSIERISNLPEIQMLINEGVISNIEDKDIYFSPDGMTNIAKKLLMDFNIFKEHKLVSIDKENENYKLFKPVEFDNFVFFGDHIDSNLKFKKNMIRLNSSDAFGSGSHPTTKGCLYALRMLQKKIVVSNFLDIGCGSGILSICGYK